MAYSKQLMQRAIELSPGRSAGEVIRALRKEYKTDDLPDERTIRRWRKAEPVIHSDGEQPKARSSLTDNLKEHYTKLVGVADRLLSGDLKRVVKWVTDKDEVEYYLYDESEEHVLYRLTEDDLAGEFDQNIILAYRDYTEWFFKTCFLPHLYAEWPNELTSKGLYIIAEEQPYQLIETLRLLSERKTFKGTCPVCDLK